ncbi:MAG: Zn-dependent hydrolase [Bacteroidota bacterium]|nr:Zn-dependent hydrolase [Bacteroidota bacterium]
MSLEVNPLRFAEIFRALTRDGATAEGGLNRPALSRAHLDARDTFRGLISECGFEAHTDGAGNLSAVWRCAEPDAPTLMLGSHLDSVPNGGRFDGTLGVTAAFEVARTLREAPHPKKMHLEVMDFTDEEGTWVSLMGSRAATGRLTEKDLAHPRGNPEAFVMALDRAGLTVEGILGADRSAEPPAAYLELHIEQGTRLERTNSRIGIVTGMVGIHMFLIAFNGQANHAGTTPMLERQDAALGASAFCLAVRRRVLEDFPDCVATVGQMKFVPGTFNIVPDQVTVFMELRSDDPHRAGQLEDALRGAAADAADGYGLTAEFNHLESVTESAMDPDICRLMESSCTRLGLKYSLLPSLAGHDAQSMARICPSGLLFVPSRLGYSHSAAEYTDWDDCVAGANALLQTAHALAISQ